MKKIISSLLLASVLFTALPVKRAEAGVVLFASGIALDNYMKKIGPVASTVSILTAMMLVTSPGLFLPALGLIVLDANDGQLNSELSQSLSERYNFIQNEEVTNQLAQLIQDKAASTPVVENKIEIKLFREEIEDILAPTDLMETHPDEVEVMIQELM